MPKLAVVAAQLAEASLVVRTLLLFFGLTGLLLLWVPINTLGLLLVTVAVLFEELTDWDFLLDIDMEVFAVFTLFTYVFKPVNTHLLLEFRLVALLQHRVYDLAQVVRPNLALLAVTIASMVLLGRPHIMTTVVRMIVVAAVRFMP